MWMMGLRMVQGKSLMNTLRGMHGFALFTNGTVAFPLHGIALWHAHAVNLSALQMEMTGRIHGGSPRLPISNTSQV